MTTNTEITMAPRETPRPLAACPIWTVEFYHDQRYLCLITIVCPSSNTVRCVFRVKPASLGRDLALEASNMVARFMDITDTTPPTSGTHEIVSPGDIFGMEYSYGNDGPPSID